MDDRALFFIVVGLLGLTAYLMATAPKITAQQRKEMEEDWWG
jgi:Tfp pilus assembly protein PilV